MKRLTLILAVLFSAGFLLTISAANKKDKNKAAASSEKALVVYFSATGNTSRLAKQLAEQHHADMYHIIPATKYSKADLDWHNSKSRSSVEMANDKARPNMKGNVKHMEKYNTIYLGYPIWWGVAPRIINTFIDANPGLKGKTIIPFATSGSSTIEKSVEDLRATYPYLTINDGIKITH
jgi:flavodoxin